MQASPQACWREVGPLAATVTDGEAAVQAVRANGELGALPTWSLAGEELVRGRRVPHADVRPCAKT